MTSILEQYNKTLTRERTSATPMMDPTTSSGYVSVRIKEESPIFSKQKMKIHLKDGIQHLTVCNNWLLILMSNNVLLRLFILQPERQDGKCKMQNIAINKNQ